MDTRRAVLCLVAVVLIAGDCIWYRQRVTAPNATITYVGIDSLTMMVPAKTPAATLKGGGGASILLRHLDQFRFISAQAWRRSISHL
jgi:hypothetical protein